MTDRSGATILVEGRPANRGMGEERGNKKQVDAMRGGIFNSQQG